MQIPAMKYDWINNVWHGNGSIVIVVIINELRSYLRFVIVVSKQDFKFEQNPFMDSGDIGCARQLSVCMHVCDNCLRKVSYCVQLVVTKQDLKF